MTNETPEPPAETPADAYLREVERLAPLVLDTVRVGELRAVAVIDATFDNGYKVRDQPDAPAALIVDDAQGWRPLYVARRRNAWLDVWPWERVWMIRLALDDTAEPPAGGRMLEVR